MPRPHSRTRVAHLTSVHTTMDTRIFWRQCKSVQRAGYDLALIAVHDRDEVIEGIPVLAVPRARNRAERLAKTWRHILKAAIDYDAALYHFHDPELIPLGLWLRRLGKHVIYDVHEDVPLQIRLKTWLPGPLRAGTAMATDLLERLAAHRLSAIVSATPPIANKFKGFSPAAEVVTVQNFPPLEELSQAGRPWAERERRATFVGVVCQVRGANEAVDAMACIEADKGIRLDLLGNYSPPELGEALAGRLGWQHTDASGGRVTREELASKLGKSMVGLVCTHMVAEYPESYPVKMFEYMSAGIPVVASECPLWRQIVTEANCGILVDPMDPQAIASAIEELIEDPRRAEQMGRNGRNAVEAQYNWRSQEEKLLQLYERLIGVP